MRVNTIYCGDATEVMARFPENSVDLIYVDPPFFSNRRYEVVWGNNYELRSFEDRWKGGIENYIAWMEPKLRECHRLLKSTGSMYLHCNWYASASLRYLMDKIFGEANFKNEIIWHYHTGGVSKRNWARKHDNILFYVKNRRAKYTFNLVKERRYYEKPFFGATEGYQKDSRGRLYIMAHPDNVWYIPAVLNVSKEYRGYPTQKPEALLEKIIAASSNRDDLVLDPMCGGGTTIAVAQRLGRRWIGNDISPIACRVMMERMREIGVEIDEKDIIGLPKTLEEVKAMQPFEFQNWVCDKLAATVSRARTGDMGIDGWIGIEKVPLQVKQSENVGRNVVDNFETAVRRAGKAEGVIVALSFSRSAYEEAARAANQDGLKIVLKTVAELVEV
jgi:DNA modification methylase